MPYVARLQYHGVKYYGPFNTEDEARQWAGNEAINLLSVDLAKGATSGEAPGTEVFELHDPRPALREE